MPPPEDSATRSIILPDPSPPKSLKGHLLTRVPPPKSHDWSPYL